MSELTNKRLEEIAEMDIDVFHTSEMARELLSLRALRDAGDEEVREARYRVDSTVPESPEESVALDHLEHIAITRGKQLREAREEIERLKGDADRYRWLRSHSWHEPYHIFFGPGCNQLEPHHLDQAIDNEMKYPIIEGDQT